jgi:hypothetical protein
MLGFIGRMAGSLLSAAGGWGGLLGGIGSGISFMSKAKK